MTAPFINSLNISDMNWRAFERALYRLLLHEGYEGVRLIGQTRDHGADVLAHRNQKRWAVQIKHWNARVGPDVLDRTIQAARSYRADIPAIAALSGFTENAYIQQRKLIQSGIRFQLWDRQSIIEKAARLGDRYPAGSEEDLPKPRDYQAPGIEAIVRAFLEGHSKRGLVVMATGLGKTFVIAEAARRLRALKPDLRIIVLAHTNDLVYQLERSFWKFMTAQDQTAVWNQHEKPTKEIFAASGSVFACYQSVYEAISRDEDLPEFDLVVVDEAHHGGSDSYQRVLEQLNAGSQNGPFLIGLTATPWRADKIDLQQTFGSPLVSIDMVTGMRKGFLANVDYRLFTDNIDWDSLKNLKGEQLSPRQINRTLFIKERDDGVVEEIKRVWREQKNPRAIVFCGTIDHAIRMRDRINSLRFCTAKAIYSSARSGPKMTSFERNVVLTDFHDGKIDLVCAVDIFNEGVDVPDVNIIIFQRVTHSRRIFVQQLGRGLRIAPNKEKVIVLDFVSDIRRFAAALDLKDQLESPPAAGGKATVVSVHHKVDFKRIGEDDPNTESFLRAWLDNAATVEDADEDAAVLQLPPDLPGGKG